MLTVELTENGFFLNGLKIENKRTELFDVVELLGRDYRDVALKYGITLLIYDREGIRFWVENKKVTQLQIVLGGAKNTDKFPNNVYTGKVFINSQQQSLPLSLNDVKNTGVEFVWDDDSRQYGVNMIYLMPGKNKFPLQLDEAAEFVNYLSS